MEDGEGAERPGTVVGNGDPRSPGFDANHYVSKLARHGDRPFGEREIGRPCASLER
jgi:hypothetical protein